MSVDEVKRATQALLGDRVDVSYITEALIHEREKARKATAPGADRPDWFDFFCNSIVDHGDYVSFYHGYSSEPERQGCEQSTSEWMLKPVEITRWGSCPEGRDYYRVRRT